MNRRQWWVGRDAPYAPHRGTGAALQEWAYSNGLCTVFVSRANERQWRVCGRPVDRPATDTTPGDETCRRHA